MTEVPLVMVAPQGVRQEQAPEEQPYEQDWMVLWVQLPRTVLPEQKVEESEGTEAVQLWLQLYVPEPPQKLRLQAAPYSNGFAGVPPLQAPLHWMVPPYAPQEL